MSDSVSEGQLAKLATSKDLTRADFGTIGDLVPAKFPHRELAEYYLTKFELAPDDPDAQVTALHLAVLRSKELVLLQKIEEHIHRKAIEEGLDGYGDAYVAITQTGEHRALTAELKRVHSTARALRGELRRYADECA